MAVPLAALVNLNKRPYYIHWGVIQLSAANAVVILLMVIAFFAAILLPFPKDKERRSGDSTGTGETDR
jgi:hypothetical protein